MCTGANLSLSISSRTSSIFLLDAPSISITSMALPLVMSLQLSHLLHGSSLFPLSAKILSRQFMALARIRADEVLPVPLGPVKSHECEIVFFGSTLFVQNILQPVFNEPE